ncbi:MAG TPA: pilus assembly protein TadG-related protein [Candidatus Dormibacteraeota bacterium]|nr:pilus assembly protein TadG-related protein [Candidatus Dormibacteraeota bacterium]
MKRTQSPLWYRMVASRHGRPSQVGQVTVLFAISLVVLVVGVGIAIDGGYGLLQYRQAQNAADFAAEGAAQALYPNCTNIGTPVAANELIYDINALVTNNSPSTTTTGPGPWGWTGYYLASTKLPLLLNGNQIPIYTGGYPGGDAPAGACGVHLSVTPQWPPFIAQMVGLTKLRTAAGASAVNLGVAGGPQTSIVALAENGAHTILMAGEGVFDVAGTIFDNSNGCLNYVSPGTYPNESIAGKCSDWGASDILDGKQSGTMYDWGNLQYSTAVSAPWDACFNNSAAKTNAPVPAPSPFPGANPPTNPPQNDQACSANNTNVWTNDWFTNGKAPYQSNPLTSPPAPVPADAGCNGETVNPATGTVGAPSYPAGTVVYYPGDYTSPVVITGNAVFYNCSQTTGLAASPPNPGIFYFDQGLAIRPVAGDTVQGTSVLLATQDPIPNGKIASAASTITGVDNGYTNLGDGEPTIGRGSGNCTISQTGETCTTSPGYRYTCPNNGPAGTNCNSDDNATCGNSVCFSENAYKGGPAVSCSSQPNSCLLQGLNDSLQIGGQGTVTLSSPLDGDWNQFVYWQESQVYDTVSGGDYGCPTGSASGAVCANIGLDNLLGDTANITLNGVLVDATDIQGQNPSNEQYWGGNASLPFVPGGMLVAGFGIATGPTGSSYGEWGTGFTCDPKRTSTGGSCDVTINGLADVGMFQTQGYAQLAIDGSGVAIPGVTGSAILTG